MGRPRGWGFSLDGEWSKPWDLLPYRQAYQQAGPFAKPREKTGGRPDFEERTLLSLGESTNFGRTPSFGRVRVSLSIGDALPYPDVKEGWPLQPDGSLSSWAGAPNPDALPSPILSL